MFFAKLTQRRRYDLRGAGVPAPRDGELQQSHTVRPLRLRCLASTLDDSSMVFFQGETDFFDTDVRKVFSNVFRKFYTIFKLHLEFEKNWLDSFEVWQIQHHTKQNDLII